MTIKQVSVFIENKTGRINEVTRILGQNSVNMTAFCLAENAEFGILRMIVSDVDLAVKALKDAHFGISINEVLCLSCPNSPGSLAIILDRLAKEEIFIEYMYAFSHNDTANVVIRPTDIKRCIEIFANNNFNLLDKNSLSQL